MKLAESLRPRLGDGVRIQDDLFDETGKVLLFPEGGHRLDPTKTAILALCDGYRDLGAIVATLAEQSGQPAETLWPDLAEFLLHLHRDVVIRFDADPALALGRLVQPHPIEEPQPSGSAEVLRPLGLLAELTHRCPLHCPLLLQPVERADEAAMSSKGTSGVGCSTRAAELGVLHALLSGGEPMVRDDLASLVDHARSAGLYTNLITSGVGLTPSRTEALRSAGLDSVQLSFQDTEEEPANQIAGASSHRAKLRAARLVRSLGFPLTVNVVIHRRNIARVGALIDLAESLDATRLELANVQFHGWAFRNRGGLLPDLDDVMTAERVVAEAVERLAGRMKILYVRPDYLGDRPKPCMSGWGRRYLTVNPFGDVLPCPTSGEIPGLRFENVRRLSLGRIWRESDAFQRFRGFDWMADPCRSCPLREVDFGGCRCQAALLTGDPTATDPACSLSPHRETLVRASRADDPKVPLIPREDPDRAPLLEIHAISAPHLKG